MAAVSVVIKVSPKELYAYVYHGSITKRLYRGTSLIRNSLLLGPYSRTVPRALWGSWGGGLCLISEALLYSFM